MRIDLSRLGVAVLIACTVLYRRLYTGGNDSLVRVWDTSVGAEQEPHVLGEATLDVMSIDCSVSAQLSNVKKNTDTSNIRTHHVIRHRKTLLSDNMMQLTNSQTWLLKELGYAFAVLQ